MVLEFLADFGFIVFAVFTAVIIYFCGSMIFHMRKNKNRKYMDVLAMCISYIPMHILYSSLYYNTILAFTVGIVVFGYIKIKERV